MLVRVRLFAILRERAGTGTIELELADGCTAEDVVTAVGRRLGLDEMLARLPVAVAVNREYADRGRRLEEGDEVALIPPVSGGALPSSGRADQHVRITDQRLSAGRVADHVRRPEAGAIVVFEGTTRDVPSLFYEAYAEMATEQIAQILEEAISRHGLAAAAVEHRTGAVALGEPSVIVAAAAAHREAAFAGAREAIDRVKAEAAIWKQEINASGDATWVQGTPPSALE